MSQALRHQEKTDGNITDYLTQEDLNYLDTVSFVNKRPVRARLTGIHRANLRGGTTEFTEHRPYTPGDEVRRLDWRAIGRSDRLEIKLYDDPSTLDTLLLLDSSGSMRFADSTRSKFDFARGAAAWLSKLVLSQHDPLGLYISGKTDLPILWPKATTSQLRRILAAMHKIKATGETHLAESLRYLTKSLKNPTRIVIISDFFCDLAPLEAEIKLLNGQRHQFTCLQVVAPEEITLDYAQPIRFANLEGPDHTDANPQDIAKTYIQAVEHHIQKLRQICLHYRGTYEPIVTDQPLGRHLAEYIRRHAEIR